MPMVEIIFAVGVFWWVQLLVRYKSGVFLRPTFFFAGAYMLQVGTGAISSDLSAGNDYGWALTFSFLAVIFPVVILAWVSITPAITQQVELLGRRFRGTKGRIPILGGKWFHRPEQVLFWICAFGALVSLAIFYTEVPFTQSGIYAVFMDPDRAMMAREESDKLLTNPIAKTGLVFTQQVFIPCLCCFVLVMQFRPTRVFNLVLRVIVAVIVIAVSSPSGARGPIAWSIILMALMYMVKNKIGRGAVVMIISIALGLTLATVFSVSRSGEMGLADSVRIGDFLDSVVWRAFGTPFETGFLTNEYVEAVGRFGFNSVAFPLKGTLGFEHVPLPNMVFLYYRPNGLESGWMNTCFLFDLQAAFGLFIGFAVSLVLICALDSVVRLFTSLNGCFCLVLYVVFLRFMLDLVSSSYAAIVSGPMVRNVMIALPVYMLYSKVLRHRVRIPESI